MLLAAGTAYGQSTNMEKTILVRLESLAVAPENRCSYYDRDNYWYPQRVENSIIARDGLISPYTMETFTDKYGSTIEHIVALAEAHDSGLCDASLKTRLAFASDLDNLALASESLNRAKGSKDVAEWLPPENVCWYIRKTIRVRQKYNLTIDQTEKNAIRRILFEKCNL